MRFDKKLEPLKGPVEIVKEFAIFPVFIQEINKYIWLEAYYVLYQYRLRKISSTTPWKAIDMCVPENLSRLRLKMETFN